MFLCIPLGCRFRLLLFALFGSIQLFYLRFKSAEISNDYRTLRKFLEGLQFLGIFHKIGEQESFILGGIDQPLNLPILRKREQTRIFLGFFDQILPVWDQFDVFLHLPIVGCEESIPFLILLGLGLLLGDLTDDFVGFLACVPASKGAIVLGVGLELWTLWLWIFKPAKNVGKTVPSVLLARLLAVPAQYMAVTG